ncbi:MAG: rhodanese-like domain-containing protein [Spirochaetia bacterium]|jgi:rhodanese-related sulfurtransferase|nr:rhodanese-like domain-containing protein [Spirochaetia bacterium]
MLKRSFAECVGIFLFSTILAFSTNFFRSDGLSLLRPKFLPPPAEDNQANNISLQTLKGKLQQPGVIILDARSSDEFAEGHIPGAKNLPYFEFAEKAPVVLKEISFNQEMIAYCDGLECSNAEDLAFLLRENGYSKIKVFQGGWEEWKENGMPIKRGER